MTQNLTGTGELIVGGGGGSNLALTYDDLMEEIGFFLGWGRDSTTWGTGTGSRLEEIKGILKSGLRQFYWPTGGHKWSFLEPAASLSTVAATEDYDLPQDFGSMRGPFTFGAISRFKTICEVNEFKIRQMRQEVSSSGKPEMFALRPKTVAGAAEQRFEVMFYPNPDAVYALTYRYAVLPNALTALLPYPYGGTQHAETLLEGCLAVAERRMDDTQGVHAQAFMERLASSIELDKKQSTPDYFGYNGNGQAGLNTRLSPREDYNVTVG